MTLHEDVARINHGDLVTATWSFDEYSATITAKARDDRGTIAVGPYTIGYQDVAPTQPHGNLVEIVMHTPAPAPLYANRPDITQPRPYDVVAAENYPGGEVIPLTYWNNLWRSHGGTMYTTDALLAVGPLTLLATAQA